MSVLLAGRQVDDHTGWMAGRNGVGELGARRTQRIRAQGNIEHKIYLKNTNSVCWDWLSTIVVETAIWR